MLHYTIKELSEKTGLSHSTLRYYEEIGLLTNVRHEGNRRIYTEEHLRRIDGILCFKNTNLPISKILEFYNYEENLAENISDIINLVETHEQNIIAQIDTLQQHLEHIRQKVYYYTEVKKALDNAKAIPQWEDIFTQPSPTSQDS